MKIRYCLRAVIFAALAMCAPVVQFAWADAISDWNIKGGQWVTDANTGAPVANRILAISHLAMYEATNAITRRYPPSGVQIEAAPGSSVDAAIAAAAHVTLAKLLPTQQAAIDAAYQVELAKIPDGPARAGGVAIGEKAAAAALAQRGDDGASRGETYRPFTTPGVYVPTVIPAAAQWPQRTPWLMTGAAQFRPGPPPALTSDVWARDFNEVKSLGARSSTTRSAEQTEIARFWEATLPPIYHGLVRSVANTPGREITQNARLFMAVTQASDEALIAVFDAKYQYGFWRPITAIRNADVDGNGATERDPAWVPFIDTPMHPEYPCAHCIVSSAIGTVLQAAIGAGPPPTLTTTSSTAKGASRTWASIPAFMEEVANARVYDGVHYRNSAEVETAMGKKVGALAVAKYLQ